MTITESSNPIRATEIIEKLGDPMIIERELNKRKQREIKKLRKNGITQKT